MTKLKHDRLLAALLAKLPEGTQWPRAGRIAWLRMMAMAFDVVYGPCGEIRVPSGEAPGDECGNEDHAPTAPLGGENEYRPSQPPAPGPAMRFHVDRDGFAMGDGRPIAVEDLPAGAILWDERVGIECGDAGAILWRGTGASRRALPPDVTLRPVFDET